MAATARPHTSTVEREMAAPAAEAGDGKNVFTGNVSYIPQKTLPVLGFADLSSLEDPRHHILPSALFRLL